MLWLSCVVGALSHITSTATRSGDSAVHKHDFLMVRNCPVILLKLLSQCTFFCNVRVCIRHLVSNVFYLSEKPNSPYFHLKIQNVYNVYTA